MRCDRSVGRAETTFPPSGGPSFGPLLEGGVKIFEYRPDDVHLKTMVVDGVLSTVGSANFDDRSFHLNEEANLFVYDGAFAGQMKESYQRDVARCRPYTRAMWRSRSLKKKATEWLVAPSRSSRAPLPADVAGRSACGAACRRTAARGALFQPVGRRRKPAAEPDELQVALAVLLAAREIHREAREEDRVNRRVGGRLVPATTGARAGLVH